MGGRPALWDLADAPPGPYKLTAGCRLGLEDDKRGERRGHLYVFAIPLLLSDFMDLENYPLTEMHALRLNAVCPPDAVRPHFQDGFLLTWPLKDGRPDREASVARKLVAKFRLIDTGEFMGSAQCRPRRSGQVRGPADVFLSHPAPTGGMTSLLGPRVSARVCGIGGEQRHVSEGRLPRRR